MSRKQKNSKKSFKPVNVVLPSETYDRLEAEATRDNRAKANLARLLIEEGLDRRALVGTAS